MNKEQTAIEVDALEWFNNLEDDTASRLYKLYFPVVSKDTYYNDIIFIYTAEHPTAPTDDKEADELKQGLRNSIIGVPASCTIEDSNSEEKFEAKLRKQYDNVGYDSEDPPFETYLSGGRYAKKLMEADNDSMAKDLKYLGAENTTISCRLDEALNERDRLRENNKALIEALQPLANLNLEGVNTNGDNIIYQRNKSIIKLSDVLNAIKVLEQTK